MAHGGYGKRRVAGHKPRGNHRPKGPGAVTKKPKTVSLKNQIRSTERALRKKDLPPEVREAQEKKLADLKKQQELHNRLAIERKIFLRDRKIKFFERRKIERKIRRLEKQQRSSSGQVQEAGIAEQLAKLKEDLEYVRFFPKAEKYVPLFSGGENTEIIDRRNRLRKQIKDNLIAAAASGKDLEETGSEDDGVADLSEDDFFGSSSSDEADADDEWTDKSMREQASSASGRAASSMSSDERNQKQISARGLMPPPRPSTSRKSSIQRAGSSMSGNSSNRRSVSSSDQGFSNSQAGQSSNLSSNSDAHKRKRKRRPKKKKQQA